MENIINNLRKLSYGLYAIGAMDINNNRPSGCIVNTVFQVTSDNPIIAISMNKNNYTYDLIKQNKKFSVSILSEKASKDNIISQLGFVSGRDKNKFEGLDYYMLDELPVLGKGCCGGLTCEVVSMAETLTHFVILASVISGTVGNGDSPMTYRYYHEVVKGSAPKNAPSYVAPELLPSEPTSGETWVCDVCGYIYEGDLTKEPDTFRCPLCNMDKSHFKKQ